MVRGEVGKRNGVKALVLELVDRLESCVRQCTFVAKRDRRIPWNICGQHNRRRGWNDHTCMLLASSEVEVADQYIAKRA